MNFRIEQQATESSIEYKVVIDGIPKPKIVDVSQWPKFVVEWMGRRIDVEWLGPGLYLIGGKTYDYGQYIHSTPGDQMVVVRLQEGDQAESSPDERTR